MEWYTGMIGAGGGSVVSMIWDFGTPGRKYICVLESVCMVCNSKRYIKYHAITRSV